MNDLDKLVSQPSLSLVFYCTKLTFRKEPGIYIIYRFTTGFSTLVGALVFCISIQDIEKDTETALLTVLVLIVVE